MSSAKSHLTTTVQLLMVHSYLRGVPRIGCTAQSCFSCNEAKAECFHNTTSNTFTCAADTSTCSVQPCEPCQYCIGTFTSPTTSQNLTLHSLCFKLPLRWTCQKAITSEQCVLNKCWYSCGVHDFFFDYRCYGENCTERLLYTNIMHLQCFY